MSRHILSYAWWLLVILAMLGACALTVNDEEPLRLRLATWSGYAPLYAVDEHDLAAPTRLEVSTAELAQDNYRAFAEGRVDVLATTLLSAIQFHGQGTDTVIFLITDYSNGADGIIARPGIDSVADLRGQRVGVESGSISHLVLLRALEQANLPADTVEIVSIGVPEAVEAIESGTVDAAVVWEPVLTGYQESHGLPPIFTSAEIPNEVIDVLVTNPETLQERPADLVNLVRGWDVAVEQWQSGSIEVSKTMSETLNVGETNLRQQFTRIELVDLEHNRRLLDLDQPDSIGIPFIYTVEFLSATGQLEGAPPAPAELIDTSIVQQALPSATPQE